MDVKCKWAAGNEDAYADGLITPDTPSHDTKTYKYHSVSCIVSHCLLYTGALFPSDRKQGNTVLTFFDTW